MWDLGRIVVFCVERGGVSVRRRRKKCVFDWRYKCLYDLQIFVMIIVYIGTLGLLIIWLFIVPSEARNHAADETCSG